MAFGLFKVPRNSGSCKAFVIVVDLFGFISSVMNLGDLPILTGVALHLLLIDKVAVYFLFDEGLVLSLQVVFKVVFLAHVGCVVAVVVLLLRHELNAQLVYFVL